MSWMLDSLQLVSIHKVVADLSYLCKGTGEMKVNWRDPEVQEILWKYNNLEAAEKLHVSPQTVSYARTRLGIPTVYSQGIRKRTGGMKVNWNDPEIQDILRTHTNREVSEKLGVSQQRVAQVREQLGIPSLRPYHRIDWTEEMDDLLGTKSDATVAAELNTSSSVVQHRREKKGIPAYQTQQYQQTCKDEPIDRLNIVTDHEATDMIPTNEGLKIPALHQMSKPLTWTREMDALLDTMSDTQVVRVLQETYGITTNRQVVWQRRKRLDRAASRKQLDINAWLDSHNLNMADLQRMLSETPSEEITSVPYNTMTHECNQHELQTRQAQPQAESSNDA